MSERFVIITTMKNEGPFVLEWVAYNLSIGFTDFLIFTNDCADGTDMLAQRLQRLGYVTHIPNPVGPGESPQRKALRKARKHTLVRQANWLFCADVDEFLNIRTGQGRLPDLLQATGDAAAISICWKLFGNGGITGFDDSFVTRQFQWACPEHSYPSLQSRGLKTLFRNDGTFSRIAIHRPRLDKSVPMPRWVDAGGQPMPEAYHQRGWAAHANFDHSFARLHHYALRSADSFLVKRDRGRTNHIKHDQGPEYWARLNFNIEHDESILAHLPAARAIYDDLLTDPRLARWHTRACRWHRHRIAKLREIPEWDRFHRVISTQGELSLAQGACLSGFLPKSPPERVREGGRDA
ncbi:glycosyltransferase family 2 protein [Roseovarius litorisediminis]|nr:glycosyltransferase family 2 protein [Roseovarius litorisediminis]